MPILFSSIPEFQQNQDPFAVSEKQVLPGCSGTCYKNDTCTLLVQTNSGPTFQSYDLRVQQQAVISYYSTNLVTALVYQLAGKFVRYVEGSPSGNPTQGHYQLLVLQPNDYQTVQLNKGVYKSFVLGIDGQWLAALSGEQPAIERFLTLVKQEQKSKWMEPCFIIDKKMRRLINEMLQCTREKMTRASFLRERTMALINFFLNDVSNFCQQATRPERVVEEGSSMVDALLSQMIDGDEADFLTIGGIIKKLAQKLRLPEYTLKKKFISTHHTTLYHHIKGMRMTKMARLLKTTNKPVSEIAWVSGYEEFSSFTRAFVQYFGITPSQYRAHPNE